MSRADALRCGKPRCPCARGQRVHCPAHDDANPSLTLTERDDRTLWHCHAGCSQEAVGAALSRLNPPPDTQQAQRDGRNAPDVLYRYQNATGILVAEKGRWNRPGDGGKVFAWRVPDGTWADGLGALRIEALPLYNLADVLRRPDEPVWFAEGEKATGALRDRGLVAVCLGGGASQQMFGNALDVLRDRDVILWPDNDEPGFAYMERIGRLLPRAKMVRPVVPEKGDAYDYFEQGGTVEALQALIRDGQPGVRVVGDDAVEVEYPTPGGLVTFAFSELSVGRRATDAMCLVRVARRVEEYSTRLNVSSSSAREGMRRDLERMYKSLGVDDWTTVVNRACSMAEGTIKRIDASLDLADVTPAEKREWAVDRFAPAGAVTVLFGMGGSGKSLLAADLLLHVLYGEPWLGRPVQAALGVLVVDYEDRPDEWRLRCEQICRAHGWTMPAGFRYLPGRAIGLADQALTIRALIERYDIGVVVVDSAASAVGGELKDPAATARLCNFLAALGAERGVTTILIAHNTKTDDRASTMFPYGDIYWHNLPRATHYLQADQKDGSSIALIDIWNRKGNRGKQRPIPVRIEFPAEDDLPIDIQLDHRTPVDVNAHEGAPDSGKQKWTIAALLDVDGALTVMEIAESTGISEASVRRTLNRHAGDLFVKLDSRRWGHLSVRDEREAR